MHDAHSFRPCWLAAIRCPSPESTNSHTSAPWAPLPLTQICSRNHSACSTCGYSFHLPSVGVQLLLLIS